MPLITAVALSDVVTQLKWAEEYLGSLQARLALQKKFLDELERTIIELGETDDKQNDKLTQLEERVSPLCLCTVGLFRRH